MNDGITVNVVTLDDQKEYVILDKISHNLDTFVFLASKEDEENILVRKRVVVGEDVFLGEVSNFQELQLTFSLVFKKHPELLKESQI